MGSTCVVGLGSPHGDDRFGWLVADHIAQEIKRCGIAVVDVRHARSPAQLLDWLEGVERLLLIDACHGLDCPGHWLRVDWPAQEFQRVLGSGSHDCSVWQTLELAAALGQLPPQCRLWCAPGEKFAADATLSPSLLALAPQVADDVLSTLLS
jgi:hydrogenase maturation protease